jgi:hypothetical protein
VGKHERRAYPRRRTDHLKAWVSINGEASTKPCRVLNTSAIGALIETELFLPTDMRIRIALEFRDQGNRRDLFVRKARVVRRMSGGVGVAFDKRM